MIQPATILPEKVGAPWAQCGVCRNVFTTVGNFDKHRVRGKCVDPSSVGLVINTTDGAKRGMWQGPEMPKIEYTEASNSTEKAKDGSGAG